MTVPWTENNSKCIQRDHASLNIVVLTGEEGGRNIVQKW